MIQEHEVSLLKMQKRFIENKLLAFEYTIKKLIEWYKSLVPNEETNVLSKLSKLKLFKLHFFVAAVNSTSDSSTDDLLNLFNKFYALPYGPVEGYIYDHLNELQFYSIFNDHVEVKSSSTLNFDQLDYTTKVKIDDAITILKEKNNNLVILPAFDLVEISHKWPVWKLLYANALKEGRRNEFMPSELIRISPKFFE